MGFCNPITKMSETKSIASLGDGALVRLGRGAAEDEMVRWHQ